MNYMFCLNNIKQNPTYLKNINNQDERMCIEAVSRCGAMLPYVSYQTLRIQKAAILNDPHALQFAYEQTNTLCLLAVGLDGLCIQHVKNKTPVICLAAVKQNGNAINYIPTELHTMELYKVVIKSTPSLLEQMERTCKDTRILEELCNTLKEEIDDSYEFIEKDELKNGSDNKSKDGYDNESKDGYNNESKDGSNNESKDGSNNESNDGSNNESNDGSNNESDGVFKQIVYYKNIRKNELKYIKNGQPIQQEIEKIILDKYGKNCLDKAMHYQANDFNIEQIKSDDTFDEGAFFIKNIVYVKTTKVHDVSGWFLSSKMKEINIHKIREYGIMYEE
jgi:hypothetical protein